MLTNTYTRRIEWGDCDPAGIVFNPNFFAWFDHGTALLFEQTGWTKQAALKEFGGLGFPVVETGAKFKRPCRWGDTVEITSTVVSVGTSSFEVAHVLKLDGQAHVEGQETRVWTDRDPDTGRISAAPLPAPIAERMKTG